MNRPVVWILVLAGIVAAVGAMWYFTPASQLDVTNYPSAGTDIIAFGDSLVSGTGSTRGNDFVSLLEKRIGQNIVNMGVPGNTTAFALARVSDIDAYDPKVVLVLLGGNDHLRQVPIQTTFENLSKIIEHIHARGAVVLLLGVKGSLLGDQFAPEFEALQKKYGTAYVPNVLDGLFGDATRMADSVHPNDAGYKIIADRVFPVLVPLLK